MPVFVKLDALLLDRKVTSRELAAAIGITPANLSLFKSSKVQGVRFDTLAAICRYLKCEPGDLLGYRYSEDDVRRRLDDPDL